jgi:hypothetical protein
MPAVTKRGLIRDFYRGGMWLLFVNKRGMKTIIENLHYEKGTTIKAIQCETIAEAAKLDYLFEAFDLLSLEEIRKIIKLNTPL